MDGQVITPNLLFFLMVLIHPNLQRKFFSYRGGAVRVGVLMPNMIFIQLKAKLFGQNPLTKNIFSSEKLTTYCEKKIKKLPFVTINGVGR